MSSTNKWCSIVLLTGFLIISGQLLIAQNKGLVNTAKSPYAKLQSVDMGDVQWTKGFWADRFAVCKDSMVPRLWQTYNDAAISHSFKNFEIAAGLDTGSFVGPSFHDGDFYKTLEAVAALYASTKDKHLDSMMDRAIAVIAKAQREDGYIYTKVIIEQKKKQVSKMFEDKLSFEAYNFGHLMTAACVHYRATGKTSLLDIAKKATDFLMNFYDHATPEQSRNAICPSHYMGITEMYRTTGDPRYLALVKKLINIRGTTEGTEDNSDRVPFRSMKTASGHAVRANYLFAGVADVYAETGDTSLLSALDLLWKDVVYHKMYITGGCGALYDGVSPDGVSYNPDTVQRIQQAYAMAYQLPNFAAHNETCANVGNLLWNWRLLQVTANAKYADVLELALYNSILSGISLSGTEFFYTNPLAVSDDYPYQLRWSGGRKKYITLSNCCPPNVVRTIAEVGNYAYSISEKGLYVNLYGGNTLHTHLKNGIILQLDQQSNYPWDGSVKIVLQKIQKESLSVFLRIPGWCAHAKLTVNGIPSTVTLTSGEYAEIRKQWKTGDVIELILPMTVNLMEANPLVEETRNQVAVKRGPIVYCLESPDMKAGESIADIAIPAAADWTFQPEVIANSNVLTVNTIAKWHSHLKWKETLYQPITPVVDHYNAVKLIPYFAWSNRGHSEMSVWLPLSR